MSWGPGILPNGVHQPFWHDWATEPKLFKISHAWTIHHCIIKCYWDHAQVVVFSGGGGAESDFWLGSASSYWIVSFKKAISSCSGNRDMSIVILHTTFTPNYCGDSTKTLPHCGLCTTDLSVTCHMQRRSVDDVRGLIKTLGYNRVIWGCAGYMTVGYIWTTQILYK